MSFRDQKVDLLKWANDQVHLPSQTKAVLKELASFADADGCAWAKVATLAYAVNLKERQVQTHLERLRADGAVRLSGRMHRLKKSTRSVPVYQLAPTLFDGLDEPPAEAIAAPAAGASMGAEDCTHTPAHGCSGEGGMGAAGCAPHRRPLGDQSGAKAPSPGAREIETLFAELEAATPARCWKNSDREAALEAFTGLAGHGVDVSLLAGCSRRMAVDPIWLSKRIPEPLERWIAKFQWRGWLAAEGSAAAEALPASSVPDEVRAAVLAATDEAFVRSYLIPCRYETDPEPRLVAKSSTALQRLDRARAVFAKFGIVVVGERT